jgi:hypothetical protein
MPAEQSFGRQRPIAVLRRVEHHLHDALHVPVSSPEPANVETEPARDRRANLIGIERLTFDRAALDHVFGERAEDGWPYR